ncbi:MAG: hypothetical protein IKR61_07110, partial [Lachnospiraceae bacterium]|nr:hypothetical protein [Lachnospiraceae bacterium]
RMSPLPPAVCRIHPNSCNKPINETCTKIRKELCEEYERGAGFTPEEIRKGYHGGNEGDASRFRKQKKKK